MEGASEEDSALQSGAAEDSGRFGLEELCFFLICNGVSEAAVFGWHDGWSLDRLSSAFRFFKGKAIEDQRSAVIAVSVGASSLFSKDAVSEYMKKTDNILSGTNTAHERRNAQDAAKELDKLAGLLNG